MTISNSRENSANEILKRFSNENWHEIYSENRLNEKFDAFYAILLYNYHIAFTFKRKKKIFRKKNKKTNVVEI